MRVEYLARDALVLHRRPHHRIKEKDNDIRLLDRLLRTEEGEIVDGSLRHLRVWFHTRRVDEHVAPRLRPGTDRERHLDRVARRARDLGDDHPRRVEEPVDVRGLPSIRPPDDGDP